MRGLVPFLIVLALAALVPLATPDASAWTRSTEGFPGWPAEFEGAPLTEVPLSERELKFYKLFPGQVARFTDGERQFVLRWIRKTSRHLHPASVCFRGRGYEWEELPTSIDAQGARWGEAIATRGDDVLRVKERIQSADGQTWSDVAAWYWQASLGHATGPYLSVLVASAEDHSNAQ